MVVGDYSLKSRLILVFRSIFIGFGLVTYATGNLIDLKASLVDAVWSILYYGFAEALISWTHKILNQQKQ